MAMNNGFGSNFYNRYMSNNFRNSNTVSEVASSDEPMMEIAAESDIASNDIASNDIASNEIALTDAVTTSDDIARTDPGNVPRSTPNTTPGNMPRNAPNNTPRNNPNNPPRNMPRSNPSNTPNNMPRSNPSNMPHNMPRNSPNNMPNNMPRNNPGNMRRNNPQTVPATPPPAFSDTDFGPEPFIVDINKATMQNNTFRTALWTGEHLQLTLMSLEPGEDIGLEVHPNTDQFLRIESGRGVTMMGNTRDNLYLRQPVFDDTAIIVPAGTWHNIINTGTKPLKLYSIYAPPNHPYGTVHQTKEIAEQMGD